jgi:uncharacterized protein YbaP (TraB family)
MENKIYLCGTVHLDLAGPQRLRKVLQTLSPDHIAIESYPELSQEILEKRKEYSSYNEQTLLQRLRDSSKLPIEGVRPDSALALLNCVGYEVWVPFEYAERTGTQIVHIEDKERAQKITKGNLEGIIGNPEKAGPIIEMLKQSPKMLKNIFDFCYELGLDGDKDEVEMVERNKVFAERIKSLNGRVLGVVGNGHVYGIEPTLQTLLKEYNPTDLKLIQADYFDSESQNK